LVEDKRVAVVIPAHDEEALLSATLNGVPDLVDRIIVVDDASNDGTLAHAHEAAAADQRIEVVARERNGGVGAAVVSGYRRALEDGADVTVVMNADNQMDPDDLADLVLPVARGEVDYAKANRLFTGQAWQLIPHSRYLGNAVLSLWTKIASGYWHVADAQSGYTAIGRRMLQLLDLDELYPRYGFPNDMLVHLNIWNAKVRDVPSRPIYGVGERSGIRLWKVIPTISWLLFKGFWWRMWQKYVIRDFHPLVFFYVFGLLSLLFGLGLGIYQIVIKVEGYAATAGVVVLVALLVRYAPVRHGVEQRAALELQEAAFVDDDNRAVSIATPDPPELEEAVRESRSESAGDVELPLAPVEAAADDRTALRLELRQIDSERLAPPLRSRAERVAPVAANDDALPLQSRGKVDAEAAGEMVVARARGADQLALRRLAQRAHGRLRSDDRQRLDRIGHGRVREAEVPVTAVLARFEETALDQTPQVLARRRGRDPRARCQLTRRQRLVLGQRDDERRPRGLGEQRGRGGNVRLAPHANTSG